MKILVVNAGSSSLKYQLIDMNGEKVIAKGICEKIGVKIGDAFDGFIKHQTFDGREYRAEMPFPTHSEAFMKLVEVLTTSDAAVIKDTKEISAIGHRVVQGGALFNKSMLVTDEVIAGIEELCDLAPLHNPAHIIGIRACQEVFGKELPEVVVFDNAFHSTMPEEAYTFPIPYELSQKYKIRRYGFHGTSHRYISMICAEEMGVDLKDIKVITCHIGNGASIAAIKDGKVIDTSMGLTPLDGFAMGSRSGALDPSVVTFLQEKMGWTPKETSDILNKKSGVLGVSGVSSDERDITKAIEEGNERAVLARKIQRYQIRKYIGSYVAAMDGVDAIVFAGGIGENSVSLREEVCGQMNYVGVEIDKEKNDAAVFGKGGKISSENSKVAVYVIPTNEELMIARDTKEIVNAL